MFVLYYEMKAGNAADKMTVIRRNEWKKKSESTESKPLTIIRIKDGKMNNN